MGLGFTINDGKSKINVSCCNANGSRTSTDADVVFNVHSGVPTVTLGLPNRYMHTPVEMIHLKDLTQLCDLTAGFVLDLKAKERFKIAIS